jgi:hypothetical protein
VSITCGICYLLYIKQGGWGGVVNTIIVIPYKQISLLMIEKILLLELEVIIFAAGNFIKNMRLVSLFNECVLNNPLSHLLFV